MGIKFNTIVMESNVCVCPPHFGVRMLGRRCEVGRRGVVGRRCVMHVTRLRVCSAAAVPEQGRWGKSGHILPKKKREEEGGIQSFVQPQHHLQQQQQTPTIESLVDIVKEQRAMIETQQEMIQQLIQQANGDGDITEKNGANGSRSTNGSESKNSSPLLKQLTDEDDEARRRSKDMSINDRRLLGLFDARYHSTSSGATPRDHRILPKRIILVRHAESEGNVNNQAYTYLPDPQVPLTAQGWKQALQAGEMIKSVAEDSNLFFYTSPYLRSKQTYDGVTQAFSPSRIAGVQEEVQLREQDFGNFQDAEGKRREKAERLRFGRFFYRFPNGESGADVYDRMTLFEDHLVRDINAGRFAGNSSLVLVTHGLALRIFLMRWFHWTVDQFMGVYNPPNAVPLVLERVVPEESTRPGGPATWIHTKALYRLSEDSMSVLQGCTPDMCTTSWMPRGLTEKERKTQAKPYSEVHELLETLDGEEEHRPGNQHC